MKTLELTEKHLDFHIPKGFVLLDDEYKQQSFRAYSPDVLYGNKDDKAFLTINTVEKVDPYNIDERVSFYYTLYQRTVPNFSNVKTLERTLNNGEKIVSIQYTSTAWDRDLYNIIGIFPLKDKEVVITMHCDVKDGIKYALDFMNVLNYLKIKD